MSTPSLVGVGTASVVDTGTAVPGAPTGTPADGDMWFMLDWMYASVGQTVPQPVTPTNWNVKYSVTYTGTNGIIRLGLYWRKWVTGMGAPSITGAPTGSSKEHGARIWSIRGIYSDADPTDIINGANSFGSSNTLAGPIAGAAIGANEAVLAIVLRDNDLTDGASGFATLAADSGVPVTWSEVAEYGATSDNETAWAVDLGVASTSTTIPNKTFTIAGNSNAAVGMGLMWVLRADVLTIGAAGIPSAEAFGATAVVPGGVSVGPAGGIASAEAFGSPSVAFGQSIGPLGGIASAEAMGAPTVVPGTAIVAPTGIPSAFASGTQAVVPGTVYLDLDTLSRGIASGEDFGTPTITFGFATVDLPKAYPRTEIPYPAIAYELVCVSRIPQEQGAPLLIPVDPIDWTGLSFTEELSKAPQLSAGCAVSNLTDVVLNRLRDLASQATELWLYRQGKLIFSGPLMGFQVQGETLTLQAQGLLSYLRWFIVENDLTYVGVDQNLIAKALIDHYQNKPYGNYGLDTSNIAASGQARDATYLRVELHNIGQRIEELGKRLNGFDIEADPLTREVRLWTPNIGVDRSSGEDAVIFDERNVTSGDILCAASPGNIASVAYAAGTSRDVPVYSAFYNPETIAKFGRSGYAQSFDGVTEQATIDDYARGILFSHEDALLVPGPDVRSTVDADISTYGVGDTVSYQLHQRLGVTGSYRIRKRTVSVSKVGREKTAVQFV